MDIKFEGGRVQFRDIDGAYYDLEETLATARKRCDEIKATCASLIQENHLVRAEIFRILNPQLAKPTSAVEPEPQYPHHSTTREPRKLTRAKTPFALHDIIMPKFGAKVGDIIHSANVKIYISELYPTVKRSAVQQSLDRLARARYLKRISGKKGSFVYQVLELRDGENLQHRINRLVKEQRAANAA